MKRHAKLGGQIAVFLDGADVGPPPNKTVAALLLGLLARGANWSSRDDLAMKLYPDSDPGTRRASLRHALFRLRHWLGGEALEEVQDRIRLTAGSWSFDLLVAEGEKAAAAMIAPGLSHPWVEAVRREWAPPLQPLPAGGAAEFAAAVRSVACTDPDTARRILVGGAAMAHCLPVDTVGELLGLTKPKDRRDPVAIEYLEMQRFLFERLGFFTEAKATAGRAYRWASLQRKPGDMINTGALLCFMEIEDGQMGEAAAWVDSLVHSLKADTRSLLFCNAKAAYLWNMNRLDEAVAQMGTSVRSILSGDRATRLHFWTNFAVLCAEASVWELGRDALAEARSLVIPGLDVMPVITQLLAEATFLMKGRETEGALRLLEEMESLATDRGFELSRWYAVEAKAEALAIEGRLSEAKRAWSGIEARRLERCTRLTPRLLARRGRIMRATG